MWVYLDDDTCFVIDSASKLLDTLIAHVYALACVEIDTLNRFAGEDTLGYKEAEARRRLGAIFETIEGDRA